jgi:uncharacterized membrane protein YgcG
LWLCLLLIAAVAASDKHQRWTPSTYPNPQRDVNLCGRNGVKSSICDPENILSVEAANMVDGLINEIAEGKPPYRKAQCGDDGTKGFQIAVALMHKMDHAKHADKAAAAQAFAKALHDAWGVGNPACQNGVLLLLAISNREVYISTGKGVKAIVPDDQLSAVLDNIRPELKHKRYADAVLKAVQQLGQLLAGQQPDPSTVDAEDGLGIFMFFCATVAAVVGWSWYSNRKQQARYKACASKLEAIKRDQSAIQSRQYAAATCPICLEDFETPVQRGDGASSSSSSAAAAAGASRPSSGGPRTPAPADADEVAGATSPLLGSKGAGRGSAGAAVSVAVSGQATGANSSQKGRKPLVLRCGHAFCDPCITQWLKSHTNCPICRKDLEDGDEQPPAAAAPPASCAVNAPDVLQQQVYLPELGFRLRRLRMMYPDFVTDPMLYAWEEDLAAGRDLNSGVVQQFEARDPNRQRQLEEGGRAGASSYATFGGGSSYGGGGSGSSW